MPVPLDAADAIELAEVLEFLGDWLESDRDPTRVHECQGDYPRRLRAPNVAARSPSEIGECGNLQSCLEGAAKQDCLPKARI
jgi:hypothetical protein